MRLLANAALVLLTGCASVPSVQKLKPPELLLADCQVPTIVANTNGDLARSAQDLRYALVLCNNDKAALREWAKD